MAGVHNFIPSPLSRTSHSPWKNVALTPSALAYVASVAFSLEECYRISEGKTGHDEPSSRFVKLFQGECDAGDIGYILRQCRSYNTLCRQRRILAGRMWRWRHRVQQVCLKMGHVLPNVVRVAFSKENVTHTQRQKTLTFQFKTAPVLVDRVYASSELICTSRALRWNMWNPGMHVVELSRIRRPNLRRKNFWTRDF